MIHKNVIKIDEGFKNHLPLTKGAKVPRSTSAYALPLFDPVPELSGPELASKSKNLKSSVHPRKLVKSFINLGQESVDIY